MINFCLKWFYLYVICIQVFTTSSKDFKITDSICDPTELECLKDPLTFQAIKELHQSIDDDKDGHLDRNESLEFFRDDLKRPTDEIGFHKNDDFISVHDLWRHWLSSETVNWTVDETVLWLVDFVELPQYQKTFIENKVDGRAIPRFTSNSQSYASNIGIRSHVHRQKLSIKATDLVLFGPPKIPYNLKKDLAVIVSLLVGLGGCLYAYRQQKQAKTQMQKVLKDLGSLQTAEDALSEMQHELEHSKMQQKLIADDKKVLENRLENEIRMSKSDLRSEDESVELKYLEEELRKAKMALFEAEKRLEENQCLPLQELQTWLQMTYHVEQKYFDAKRELAQKELASAKEMWEKIRKQKNKFFGSFRVAHTTFLDETDQQILTVKTALETVKLDLQEKTQRWLEIEKICSFNIINNPGFDHLQKIIASNQFYESYRVQSTTKSHSDSLEEFSDILNKSSMEDLIKITDPNSLLENEPNHNKINFIVGTENAPEFVKQSSKEKMLHRLTLNADVTLPKSRSFMDAATYRNQANAHSGIQGNANHVGSHGSKPSNQGSQVGCHGIQTGIQSNAMGASFGNHGAQVGSRDNTTDNQGNHGSQGNATPEDQKSDSASESGQTEERKKKSIFKFRK